MYAQQAIYEAVKSQGQSQYKDGLSSYVDSSLKL